MYPLDCIHYSQKVSNVKKWSIVDNVCIKKKALENPEPFAQPRYKIKQSIKTYEHIMGNPSKTQC